MPRDILHFQVPAFAVAVARVVEPHLRERPVVVAPVHGERALIQAVSAEAQAEGVHEGMAVYHALRRCPSLAVLSPDPALVGRAQSAITQVLGDYSPLWEPERMGRIFLDVTGSSRLLGPGRDIAFRVEREIKDRLRLQGSVGVACNKLVSRIASSFLKKPGVCDVVRGSEQSFIAPLPVSVLPGIGPVRTRLLLEDLNLQRVAQLAALPVTQLRLVFGAGAHLVRQRAQGVDFSPVVPPRRSMEVTEEILLPQEENDEEVLWAYAAHMADTCAFRLRLQGKGATRLIFGLTYADGVREQRRRHFTVPESSESTLLEGVRELFYCQRRVRVKGMRLTCSGLSQKAPQLDLFSEKAWDARGEKLREALDQIRCRHGVESVMRGSVLNGFLRRSAGQLHGQ